MGLHVALDPQRLGVLAHQRRVRVEPVALELLARQVRQPPQAERQLDHGVEGITPVAARFRMTTTSVSTRLAEDPGRARAAPSALGEICARRPAARSPKRCRAAVDDEYTQPRIEGTSRSITRGELARADLYEVLRAAKRGLVRRLGIRAADAARAGPRYFATTDWASASQLSCGRRRPGRHERQATAVFDERREAAQDPSRDPSNGRIGPRSRVGNGRARPRRPPRASAASGCSRDPAAPPVARPRRASRHRRRAPPLRERRRDSGIERVPGPQPRSSARQPSSSANSARRKANTPAGYGTRNR